MLRVIDIELLRCSSFQELIDTQYPLTTVVRIVYGLSWLMLLDLERPDPNCVQLEWISADHELAEEHVYTRICSDSGSSSNVLYIVDTGYSFCKKIISEYNKDWFPICIANTNKQEEKLYYNCFDS